jgi:hypothetical protein
MEGPCLGKGRDLRLAAAQGWARWCSGSEGSGASRWVPSTWDAAIPRPALILQVSPAAMSVMKHGAPVREAAYRVQVAILSPPPPVSPASPASLASLASRQAAAAAPAARPCKRGPLAPPSKRPGLPPPQRTGTHSRSRPARGLVVLRRLYWWLNPAGCEEVVDGYVFFPGKTSLGNDITSTGRPARENGVKCQTTPRCVAFSTRTFLKHTIKALDQLDTLAPTGADPCPGLYISGGRPAVPRAGLAVPGWAGGTAAASRRRCSGSPSAHAGCAMTCSTTGAPPTPPMPPAPQSASSRPRRCRRRPRRRPHPRRHLHQRCPRRHSRQPPCRRRRRLPPPPPHPHLCPPPCPPPPSRPTLPPNKHPAPPCCPPRRARPSSRLAFPHQRFWCWSRPSRRPWHHPARWHHRPPQHRRPARRPRLRCHPGRQEQSCRRRSRPSPAQPLRPPAHRQQGAAQTQAAARS